MNELSVVNQRDIDLESGAHEWQIMFLRRIRVECRHRESDHKAAQVTAVFAPKRQRIEVVA